MSVYLGKGKKTYEKAREGLRSWRMQEGSEETGLVRGRERGEGGREGRRAGVVTLARMYGGMVWVMNPCCVAYEVFDRKDIEGGREGEREGGKKGGRARVWSAVAYATVGRHLIAGEERMRVIWYPKQRRRGKRREGEDEVWFEVLSLARGNGWAGWLLFPLNKRLQTKFFQDQLSSMRRIAHGEVRELERGRTGLEAVIKD